jgi:hypothetical protein
MAETNYVKIRFTHGDKDIEVEVPIANPSPGDTSDRNKQWLLKNIDEAVRDAKAIALGQANLKKARR